MAASFSSGLCGPPLGPLPVENQVAEGLPSTAAVACRAASSESRGVSTAPDGVLRVLFSFILTHPVHPQTPAAARASRSRKIQNQLLSRSAISPPGLKLPSHDASCVQTPQTRIVVCSLKTRDSIRDAFVLSILALSVLRRNFRPRRYE